jgi:hypothetical protein
MRASSEAPAGVVYLFAIFVFFGFLAIVNFLFD